MVMFKRKYLVYYVSKDKGNSYDVSRKEYITADTTNIDISKNKTIIIDTEYPSFRKGLTSFFIIDVLKDDILYFENTSKPIINAEVYNEIIRKEFFLQATSNLDNDKKQVNWTWLIVGLSIGALSGIIGGVILGGVFVFQMMGMI